MTKTDTVTALRECPFCGGAAEIIEADEAGPSAYAVQCQTRGCEASLAVVYALKDNVEDLLFEKWNRRAALASKTVGGEGEEGLWRFWNEKARELAETNAALSAENAKLRGDCNAYEKTMRRIEQEANREAAEITRLRSELTAERETREKADRGAVQRCLNALETRNRDWNDDRYGTDEPLTLRDYVDAIEREFPEIANRKQDQ